MVNGGGSIPNVSAVQSTPACLVCGIQGHQTHECTIYSSAESPISEVHYTQNQGPFS